MAVDARASRRSYAMAAEETNKGVVGGQQVSKLRGSH
jgi:hypothetical protein